MTAYYNEIDTYAAQWLRNLIEAGLIAPGIVDTRSIVDVTPSDLVGFTQCHFFAGIGGWSYAARLAGWPDTLSLWTGSCPCQPFSVAGAGAGQADARHLWPEFFRLIAGCRPSVVMGEQVAAAVGKDWLDGVFVDLESIDYTGRAAVVPACAVDTPHRRDRLWFVADTDCDGSFQRPQRQTARQGNSVAAKGDAISLAQPNSITGGQSDPITSRGETGNRTQQESGLSGTRHGVVADAERQSLALGECEPGVSRGMGGQSQGQDATDDDRTLEHADELGAGPRRKQRGRELDRARVNPWARYGWLAGADGKSRRVEPGIRLLAHGVSGRLAVCRSIGQGESEIQEEHWYNRVGALRGFGNAIVPQVAAEVIGAYLDILRALP